MGLNWRVGLSVLTVVASAISVSANQQRSSAFLQQVPVAQGAAPAAAPATAVASAAVSAGGAAVGAAEQSFAQPPHLLTDVPGPPEPPAMPPAEPAPPAEPPAEGAIVEPPPPLPEELTEVPEVPLMHAAGDVGEEATVEDTDADGPAVVPPSQPHQAPVEPPAKEIATTTTTTPAGAALLVPPAVAALAAAAELRAEAGSTDPEDKAALHDKAFRIASHVGGPGCQTECDAACNQAPRVATVDCESDCQGACETRFAVREVRGGAMAKVIVNHKAVVPLAAPQPPPALSPSVQALMPPAGLMPHTPGAVPLTIDGTLSDLPSLPDVPSSPKSNQADHMPPPALPDWLNNPELLAADRWR